MFGHGSTRLSDEETCKRQSKKGRKVAMISPQLLGSFFSFSSHIAQLPRFSWFPSLTHFLP